MFPRAFHYHRASTLTEASAMLTQLGSEAKLLAGGQSLIPLLKLRFANPHHLVDQFPLQAVVRRGKQLFRRHRRSRRGVGHVGPPRTTTHISPR